MKWKTLFVLVSLLAIATKADNSSGQEASDNRANMPMNDESDFAKLKKTGMKVGKEVADKAMDFLFGGNKFGLSFGSSSGVGLKVGQKPAAPKNAPLYFKGGCTEKPPTPGNANVKCSSTSGHCDVKCLDDFAFPDSTTQMQIRCEAPGVWKVTNWDRIPDCEPVCMPPCQNLGFCLAPNVCECPDGFEGPQCQFAKSKPCLDKPPTPMNSRVVCNEKECISTCNKGFAFPGGGKKLTLVCDAGAWTPRLQQAGTQSKKVPDCQPVCDPACQNGGRCLPNNLCECPQEFRGPQCNYPVENCAPERMNFNGGYNCTGGSLSFSCSINCGADGVFDFPPAPLYTCEYATAKFLPEPIPQCIFESEQIQYFRTNSSSRSEFLINQSSELEFENQNQSKETEWSWTSQQGFWGRKEYERYFERFFSGGIDGSYSISIPEYTLIRETAARPGTCLAWGGAHYKTFDGKVYSVQSDCRYVMVRDAVSSTFSVVFGRKPLCPEAPSEPCRRYLTIYVEDFIYEVDTQDNGTPYIRKGNESLRIPNQLDGLLFERVSNFVVIQAEGLGFTVKWDTKATVSVDVSNVLWNRTTGLCGRINGFWMDDFESRDGTRSSSLLGFVNSWEASGLTDQCQSNANEKHACKGDNPEDQRVSDEATRLCERLLKDDRFEKCREAVDPRPYYEACRWDYCQCNRPNKDDCACSALETYFHECLRQKVELPDGWRDATLCPMDCRNGRVYMMCGPINDDTCSAPVSDTTRPADFCVEGCYCPKGTALHDGKCISRTQCPCTLRQKVYPSGTQIPNDCNTCTCVAGNWQCTEIRCGSRCAVVGDPHYTTFDGHHYDFMGKCSYYLMKGDNYSIEAENVPCAGAISEAMNFPVKALSTVPSCTKTVTIRADGDVIKLKQNREVLVNGEEAILEPSVWIDGIYIRHASSVFLSVELPNGLEIWWDGLSRVYIDAPPEFYGQTKGLCGTFNENQRDDLTTPEGDVEQSVGAFANGWKTKEVCQDASVDREPPHPCELNNQNKMEAERHCAKIKDSLFQSCHQVVDPEQFYKDCVYDVCACQVKLTDCLCPAISAYAKECSHKGVLVDWIPDVRECGVHCHGGQSYQVCGNSCTRTCHDIATYPKCRRKCVEGCNCPEGQTLDPFGQCIPVHQCPCLHKGVEYPPGYKELRPGVRSPDVCTCVSARWNCRPATNDEQLELANTTASAQLQCRASHNEEFTNCEPQYPVTCKTMNEASVKKPTHCRPGCQCKKGYVFDPTTKRCIKPSECPCHHGGRSYGENERISQDCNTCTCRSGRWDCTKHQCPGICSNWGESHYKTFDGKKFDFHGNCDYMLAKGTGGDPLDKFQISIQSVPCGSSGVACSKSVTLRLDSDEESITLTRHKKLPVGKFTERIFIREAGLFTFVEVADLGLVLQWDQGTRIYLRLDPKWKGRVRGLCGNFNDNALDDFQAPSGGVTEVNTKVFGDSWRLQKYCPESVDQIDTCTIHPHRKVWSVMKCSMLKGPLFEKCHAEVPVEYYVEKCVQDACGCDMGGDCECLCTAFAAYAHECNIRGIPIRWRSRELCPLQCDDDCAAYSPCMSTCPMITCENPSDSTSLCTSDACVEGCQPKACPRGQMYRSAKDLNCVSIGSCSGAVCMVVDGVMYAEGEIIEKDACHACYCSKGKRVCQGQPCYGVATTAAPATVRTTPAQQMGTSTCRTGWSDWINSHTPKAGTDPRDYEPIPRQLNPSLPNSPVCSVDQMVDIECRTVATQISHKKTGENVDCSLINGLECWPGGVKSRGTCMDYEIRILCDCSTAETKKPFFKEPTTRPPASLVERCDPARPNRPHPTNCYSFYQCVDRLNGIELVEKTCNPPTMYNPDLMICDWPESVARVRPECGAPVATTAAPVTTTSTTAKPRTVKPSEKCDPARPHTPHPTNCHMFYHCVDRLHGIEMVPKTCNPPTMFNPETMVCDWPESVIRVRPECGAAPSTERTTTSATCADGWTDWFNVSSPHGTSGDFELYDAIVRQHPVCPKSHIRDIECKFWAKEQGTKKGRPPKLMMVDYTQSPDNSVRCEAQTGLLCYNSDQASGKCQDYTVRFLCGCTADLQLLTTTPTTGEEEECPEGYEWSSCAYRCNQLCLAYGSELRRRGYCSSSDGCAPGCVQESDTQQTTKWNCPRGSFWRDSRTCVPMRDCTCRTPSGNVVAPGSLVEPDDADDNCEVCQCLDNEYICDRSRCDFKWTTVSHSAVRNISVPTRKPKPPGPTLAPAPCSGWSDWINDNKNPLTGDYEMRTANQLRRAGFCLNGRISEIECRDADNNRPWTESRDRDLVCSVSEGLKCHPHLQGKGGRCKDYKIRYFCDCDGNDIGTDATTSTTTEQPTTPIIIWTPTTTRYARYESCPPEYLVPLLADHEKVPDAAFTATSSKGSLLGPSSARLLLNPSPENAVSWVADKRDLDQYVQVDLEAPTVVYGFLITGSPTKKEYVTSLFVLYSLDNQRFSYVTNKKGKPKLFRGPLAHNGRQRNLFDVPIEARYVRLEPQTWKHAIALQFELFGCDFGSNIVVTFRPTRPTRPPTDTCTDQMGLESGSIVDQQIKFSSVNGSSSHVRLGSDDAWIPQISSRKEYVLVDLLELRNISGVVTQGRAGGGAWVESYAVRYSTNGETWHTLLNDDGSQRIFPSNVDAETPYTNKFDRLISTRFLKIVPWQWHGAIALRMDVIGCYLPVTATVPPPDVSTPRVTPLPTYCNPCPNIPDEHLNLENCACPSTLSWNGTSCVHPSRCPCFDGHTKYAVGAVFQRHDSCSQCVCRLGGISDCKAPSCPPCAPGLYSESSTPPRCECSCRPCESGTRLCQSSNVCLDESLWCNGVEDCPDDELNCFTTTAGPVECALIVCAEGYIEENTGLTGSDGCPIFNCAPPRVRPTGAPCPEPSCPPGYTLDMPDDYDYEQQQGGQQHFQQLNDLLDLQSSQQSSQFEQFSQFSQSSDHDSQQSHQNLQNCPTYKCIPQATTPRPPTVPPFTLREDRCSMTSRMFSTFDGSEFSYDICNHILVRDREDGVFQISVHKKCSGTWPEHACTRQLRIKHANETVDLLPELRIGYKGFEYSIMQAEQMAYSIPGFSINRIGDSVIFRSNHYGFWVVWDRHTNIKIGVTSKLADHIDGLCGYYNLDSHDDQRMPSGELSYSVQEFGDSWVVATSEESHCTHIECSIQEQTAAWDKCSFLRQEPFLQCHGQDESAIERAIFRCVEVMCDCMASSQASAPTAAIAAERCTCQAMSVMAMECHDAYPAADLNGWRSKYDCSVDCGTGGAVFHECNGERCEATCLNKLNLNSCPELPRLCYPGCVCPDGLIRNSDDVCVKPSDCRDCVCDGFGDPQYFSFDRQNFTFNGNCTYVAARDKLLPSESKTDHDFQVLVKNKDCDTDSGKATCTEEVTVLFQDHVVTVRHSEPTNSLLVTLDGSVLEVFPLHLPWMRIEKLAGEHVSILLMAIQVEVSYYLESRSFRVRLPSQLYLNKTEGLCGNCNGHVDDDLHAPNGDLVKESEDFGLNWLVTKLLREPPSGEENLCHAVPQPECLPPPPEQDPCLKLLEDNAFKMCHAIVNPLPYVSACHFDICHSRTPSTKACPSLEAYARECARYQVCLDWRSPDLCPVDCPSGMQHRQCGSGCLVTCEQVRANNASCPMSVTDGCYCPDGEAFNQVLGRCVTLDRCEPCDTEGHYKGDYWKPNPCTTCNCNDQGHVQCSTRTCTLQECPFGQERAIVEPAGGECCPTIKCTQDLKEVTKKPCPVMSTPVCGRDQAISYQEVDGCLQQVCECIPSTDCPPMDNPAGYSVVGAKYVVNDTGCCPFLERICLPDQCPGRPDCPPFFETELAPGSETLCCPNYQCTPPKDVCIYEHQYDHLHSQQGWAELREDEAEFLVPHTEKEDQKQELSGVKKTKTGFKRLRAFGLSRGTKAKRSVQVPDAAYVRRYAVNDTWKDGPCLDCVCIAEPHTTIPRYICTATSCPEPVDADYVIKTEPVNGECCPRLIRTACQLETRVFKVGERWPSPGGDPCQNYVCAELADGSVVKQLQIETCTTTCPTGWEYRHENTSTCCGSCQQTACITEDGALHPLGQTWKPDPCTESVCVSRENGLQVESTKEVCDEPSDEDKALYVFNRTQETDVCCPKYDKTACLNNGTEHMADDSWATDDPCVSVTCIRLADGQVGRQETVRSCDTECHRGYEYDQPGPGECCGKCVEVACVIDGELHPLETSWNPDPCTTISCVGDRGQVQVTRSEVMCSPLSDCPENSRITKPGECCPFCNASYSQKNCMPEPLPLYKTVGYVVHSSVLHGKCSNKEPIPELTECFGHCQSRTVHGHDSIDPISECDCCQALDTKEIQTNLTCADGKSWSQVIRVPTSCSCSACAGLAEELQQQHSQHEESLSQIVQQQLQQQRQGRGDINYP